MMGRNLVFNEDIKNKMNDNKIFEPQDNFVWPLDDKSRGYTKEQYPKTMFTVHRIKRISFKPKITFVTCKYSTHHEFSISITEFESLKPLLSEKSSFLQPGKLCHVKKYHQQRIIDECQDI